MNTQKLRRDKDNARTHRHMALIMLISGCVAMNEPQQGDEPPTSIHQAGTSNDVASCTVSRVIPFFWTQRHIPAPYASLGEYWEAVRAPGAWDSHPLNQDNVVAVCGTHAARQSGTDCNSCVPNNDACVTSLWPTYTSYYPDGWWNRPAITHTAPNIAPHSRSSTVPIPAANLDRSLCYEIGEWSFPAYFGGGHYLNNSYIVDVPVQALIQAGNQPVSWGENWIDYYLHMGGRRDDRSLHRAVVFYPGTNGTRTARFESSEVHAHRTTHDLATVCSPNGWNWNTNVTTRTDFIEPSAYFVVCAPDNNGAGSPSSPLDAKLIYGSSAPSTGTQLVYNSMTLRQYIRNLGMAAYPLSQIEANLAAHADGSVNGP